MRAGELRHSIRIQRRSAALNDLGQDNEGAWVISSGRIPCKLEDLTGRELEIARQQVAEATVKITCRMIEVLTTDRALFGTRVLQIASVTPNFNGTELTIICSETK